MRRLSCGLLCAALASAGCTRDAEKIGTEVPNPSFFVEHDSLTTIRIVAEDSLSDSAYVTRLIAEPDGQSIAVVFADPGKGISAGLAVLEPEAHRARLVWPDSVGAVWWAADHRLAFQSEAGGTGGVHAIVDVHADTLEHLEAAHDSVTVAVRDPAKEAEARARATAYIDSIRSQPSGVPQQGALQYTVTHLSPAAGDSLIAFYVTARGATGSPSNPAWYLMHAPSGRVTPIDSVIGRADALTPDASAWSGDRFVYAHGPVLYAARVSPAAKTLQ